MSAVLLRLQRWRDRAACKDADPELFFPLPGRTQTAMAVCAGCPVREPCLEFAVASGQEFGIWGGADEDERRRLRRNTLRSQRERVGA